MKSRNSRTPVVQTESSPPGSFSALTLRTAQLLVALAVICGPLALAVSSPAQQRPGSTIAFVTSIQWSRQPGINRYRLQIAADENFKNIFYDGRVTGERYTVSRLLPGYYYWRVAPANFQTGVFVRPVRFFVSGGTIISTPFPPRPRYATRSATAVADAPGEGFEDVGL
jgi:hypothetical protein